VDFPPPLDVADNTQKYDYVVIPVSLKGTVKTGGVNPFGLVGFGVGFLLSSETEFKSDVTLEDGTDIEDPDVTLELGLGVDIPAGDKLTITVEGRYSLGLASIGPDDGNDIHSRTALIMGGVSMNL